MVSEYKPAPDTPARAITIYFRSYAREPSLLERRTDRNTMNRSQALRGVKGIVHCASEVFCLIMVSRTCAKTKLVLVEGIAQSKGRHVIPNIFAAQIELFRTVRMGRKIEVHIQFLILDRALEYIGCSSN